jgi:MoaD family protein
MPKVQVKYLAPLCDIAGTFQETLVTSEGDSTMDLIDRLCRRYGQPVRDLFYNELGEFRPMFIILRNAKVVVPEKLTDPLEDGDRIAFVPPIAGG